MDAFSSKLDLPTVEKVESINANHMQMARRHDRSDESYRAIAGVVKQFLRTVAPTALFLSDQARTRSREDRQVNSRKNPSVSYILDRDVLRLYARLTDGRSSLGRILQPAASESAVHRASGEVGRAGIQIARQ